MSIQYICECEKRLLFKDEHAGKKAICPGCQRLLVVPGPKANIVLVGEPESAPWTTGGISRPRACPGCPRRRPRSQKQPAVAPNSVPAEAGRPFWKTRSS